MRYIFVLVSLFILCSCSLCKVPVVSTNEFIQTNYDFNCLASDKTFSEIIICYQEQDKAEKIQNEVTNKMIKDKK